MPGHFFQDTAEQPAVAPVYNKKSLWAEVSFFFLPPGLSPFFFLPDYDFGGSFACLN